MPIVLKRLIAQLWRGPPVRPDRRVRLAIMSLDQPHLPTRRIRLTDPLAKCGDEVEASVAVRYVDGNFVVDTPAIDSADVIVVQRMFPRPNTAAICEYLLATDKPVVYETDDCLPEVPAYHGKDFYREWGPHFVEFAAKAAAVTVSTERLRQYFEPHNARTIVLPNYLNEELWTDDLLRPRASGRDEIRLGYYGSGGHRADLGIVAPALRRLLDEFPRLRLVFLGCAPEGLEPGERCEVMDGDFNYGNFPRRLAALDLDVAIAPLIDNTFNRCRSNLKFLEYGFLGIPAVYSDLEPYSGTVRDGMGYLCGDSEQPWYEALHALVSDAGLRAAMGSAARREVTANWMLGPHAHQWTDAYSAVLAASGPATPA